MPSNYGSDYPSHPHHTFTSGNPIVIFLFCVDNLPSQFINSVLSQARTKDFLRAVAGTTPEDSEQSFHLATKRGLTIDEHTPLWTRPPAEISDNENEFLGASMDDLSRWVNDVTSRSVAPIWWRHKAFVVLDKRSMEDNTAVLVNVFQERTRTIRVPASTVINAACNHSEGLEPDIYAMQDCQDEQGVDQIYRPEGLAQTAVTETA